MSFMSFTAFMSSYLYSSSHGRARFVALALALALIACVFAAPLVAAVATTDSILLKSEYKAQTPVKFLTIDDFDAALDENPLVVVAFLVPWCEHCRYVKEEYHRVPDLAAASTGGSAPFPAVFAAVDCEDQPELASRFDISSYPTFRLFRDGLPETLGRSEQAPLTGEAILSEAQLSLGMPSGGYARQMTLDDAGSWLFYRGRSDRTMMSTLFGFFPEGLGPEAAAEAAVARATFDAAAQSLPYTLRSAESSDPTLMAAFSIPQDRATIVLYKDFDEGKETFDGPMDNPSLLESWANTRNKPLVQVIDRDNLRKAQAGAKVLLHLFVHEKETLEPRSRLSLMTKLRHIGYTLEEEGLASRGDILLSLVNGVKNSNWLPSFGLEDVPLPSVGLSAENGDFTYNIPHTVGTLYDGDSEDTPLPELDTDALLEFCRNFYSGMLAPAVSRKAASK